MAIIKSAVALAALPSRSWSRQPRWSPNVLAAIAHRSTSKVPESTRTDGTLRRRGRGRHGGALGMPRSHGQIDRPAEGTRLIPIQDGFARLRLKPMLGLAWNSLAQEQ